MPCDVFPTAYWMKSYSFTTLPFLATSLTTQLPFGVWYSLFSLIKFAFLYSFGQITRGKNCFSKAGDVALIKL